MNTRKVKTAGQLKQARQGMYGAGNAGMGKNNVRKIKRGKV